MPAAFPQGAKTSQEYQRPQEALDSQGVAPVSTSSARRRDREGGRHGRAPFPESAADSAIRTRLVRLAAVPSLLVAVTCSAATAFVTRAGGVEVAAREWAVLLVAGALVCGIVMVAGAAANAEARAAVTRYARLRQVCARSQSDLYDLLHRVRQGEWLQHRDPVPPQTQTSSGDGDTLDLLADEVAAAGRAAEVAVIDAVAIARSNASGSEQKVEVFVNLARRLQSLVHREIELLDELENQVEDPDLLKGLFHVDHLATRIRRHAENLAVLGGAISRRQWSRPVTMTEVLRSSIAEVEQYPRVKLVPPIEGTLRGHAVADVIHLLAELVENASVYSAPHTHVLLRAQLVTAGLAVEVEDRGLGMSMEDQARMNALLADPEHVDVAELLSDGRIGLFVVSSLARRHGIVVRLQSNIYGGVQAVLVLPTGLLGAEGEETGEFEEDGAGAAEPADAGPRPVSVEEYRAAQAGRTALGAATTTASAPAAPAVFPADPSHRRPVRGSQGAEPLDAGTGLPSPSLPTSPMVTRAPAGSAPTGPGPAGSPSAGSASAGSAGATDSAVSAGPVPYGSRGEGGLRGEDGLPGADGYVPAAGAQPGGPHLSGTYPGGLYEAAGQPGDARVAGQRPADSPPAERPGSRRHAAGSRPPARVPEARPAPSAEARDLPSDPAMRTPSDPAMRTPSDDSLTRTPSAPTQHDPGPVLLPPPPPAAPDDGARPRLPRRRKQEHLVPQLRGDPILPSARRDPGAGPEPEHDPNLMAAFRRGISLADDSYDPALSAATAATSGTTGTTGTTGHGDGASTAPHTTGPGGIRPPMTPRTTSNTAAATTPTRRAL
ncbi:ATP-binding protein [Streptomyces sp. MST-110588]|uniref:ATP-binding protein n=1 Tax=Streptomyces sp. MST-110588 TaxID=2833628 RepID=UPI0024141E40|nr:ATP-binding protein [Streptomyces sp. MST-110588]